VAIVGADGLVTGQSEGDTWVVASIGAPVDSILVTVQMRGAITIAFDEGVFLDLFFHQIPPEHMDALRATLEVVAEFRDRVLPYHELYPVWARSVF
jgi:hypothetical protein